MHLKQSITYWSGLLCLGILSITTGSCRRDHEGVMEKHTITIENILDSKPLVESGTFKGAGNPPVIMPGQSVTIRFAAGKGQAISFAAMYGWSNDLFFAPDNPGIQLYGTDGQPMEGDVSSTIRLWDNGTRINQKPGMSVTHPGTAEATPQNIMEIKGTDAQGNTYLSASKLLKATLAYNGKSMFTLTLMNISGGTANETPISPGVWAISYAPGGNLLNPTPIYESGKPSDHGLTNIAEAGDNMPLSKYLTDMTGIFTPLSPVIVVVYQGNTNPIYQTGEADRGEGLKDLAQMGDPTMLAAALKKKPAVKAVYVLKEPSTTVLLPRTGSTAGGKVTQQLELSNGDRIAVATMYGLSNDWFFATKDDLKESAFVKENGDLSSSIGLYDDGTAVNQYPGAGQGGDPIQESKPIMAVPNPNEFTTLPAITKIIKVTLN